MTYDETQARVGLHTRASLLHFIEARMERDHPDDVPCFIAFKISGGLHSYLQWIYDATESTD